MMDDAVTFAPYDRDNVYLSAQQLGCQRGGRLLFQRLDFELEAGQAAALTGMNGSGKTSLLRMIAGLLPVASGKLKTPSNMSMHYIAHQSGLSPRLTVSEILSFWKNWLSVGASQAMGVEAALAYLGLAAQADFMSGDLSAGQMRRLALARLLVAPRPIWLLDEPANALDTTAQKQLQNLIKNHLDANGLVVMATHDQPPYIGQNIQLPELGGQLHGV